MKIVLYILVILLSICPVNAIMYNNTNWNDNFTVNNMTLNGDNDNYYVLGIGSDYFNRVNNSDEGSNWHDFSTWNKIENNTLTMISDSISYTGLGNISNYTINFVYRDIQPGTNNILQTYFYSQSNTSFQNEYHLRLYDYLSWTILYETIGGTSAIVDDSLSGGAGAITLSNNSNVMIEIIPGSIKYYMNGTYRGQLDMGTNFTSGWIGFSGSDVAIDNFRVLYKTHGNLTSIIHNSSTGNHFKSSTLSGEIPNNTSVAFYTNQSIDNTTWSGWVLENSSITSGSVQTSATPLQYYQIRYVTNTTDYSITPIIQSINIKTESSITAPNITSYSPSTPNSTYENVGQTFTIDINQIVNTTWYVDSVLMQTNTSVTAASYFNNTALNGTYNVTAIVTNTNGTDSQKWDWTVLPNSVDFVYRNINYSNLTANVLIDISNKTAGLQIINIPWTGNLSSTYCLNYPNDTAVQSCITCTSEGDTIWFNGSVDRLPELDGYYINETLSTTTSILTIPANAWGIFNNWTSQTTFSAIAANESNDICYTYYNVTTGLWESYYVGYSWNSDYQLSKDASVIGYFDVQTDITSNIITPSSTELYTGWNMLGVQSSSNQTISGIIADIGTNCSDSWYFNSSTGGYSNTTTHSIQPNQGFLAYITQNMTWSRSAI